MSDVASWLNATEMNLEREIDRLRAEVRALRALWQPVHRPAGDPKRSGSASINEVRDDLVKGARGAS
ncbi:MAG TPA: hypothetical protein VGH28_04090 [Polyangiaceae bacterium]|jgi:small-conductance mechanosensitive channel